MKPLLMLATIASLAVSPILAESAHGAGFREIIMRCSENDLDDLRQAHERNSWALKCFPEEAREIRDRDAETPPLYALVSNADQTNWNAPTDPNASCGIWTRLQAFCKASHHLPEVPILLEEGYVPLGEAMEREISRFVEGESLVSQDGAFDSLPLQDAQADD